MPSRDLGVGALHRVVAGLSPAQLQTLAAILEEGSAGVSSKQVQRTLGLSTARAAALAQGLAEAQAAGVDATAAAAALLLLGRERLLAAASAGHVEVVCTSPRHVGVPVRATLPKAIELVDSTKQEILMLGYAFSGAAGELFARVAAAQQRGVHVVLVANRLRDHLPDFKRVWPGGVHLPLLYTREEDPEDDMAALHAKILICDRETALVTSANLTHHGLRRNIEVGLSVTNAAITQLREFVIGLIEAGEVQPVS